MIIDSDSVIAIIFIITLLTSGIIKTGYKRPILAQVVIGVGALVMAAIAYVSHSTVAPAWIVALSGLLIFVGAWREKKKAKH